jgi:hypothetical protein
MAFNKKHIEFIKRNRDILSEIFRERIEVLKEDMVMEKDEAERNKIRELIIEFKRWLIDIKIFSEEKELPKDTGI